MTEGGTGEKGEEEGEVEEEGEMEVRTESCSMQGKKGKVGINSKSKSKGRRDKVDV